MIIKQMRDLHIFEDNCAYSNMKLIEVYVIFFFFSKILYSCVLMLHKLYAVNMA